MKKLLTAVLVFITISLFAQDKPDSTLFKEYTNTFNNLIAEGQKLEDAKFQFMGKYSEELKKLQTLAQFINAKLEEQKMKLGEKKK